MGLRIGIVEDDENISDLLKVYLLEMKYKISFVTNNADEARELVEQNSPDLLFMDINIYGEEDGIELAKSLKNNHEIPIIFLTSQSDKRTIDRVKQLDVEGYLVKPFKSEDIKVSIEMAIAQYEQKQLNVSQSILSHKNSFDSIFIRDKSGFLKVLFSEIKWVFADKNYIHLQTTKGKKTLRSSLKDLEDKLSKDIFLRVHRSYIVNVDFIQNINQSALIIDNEEIPISRSVYKVLLDKFNFI